MKKVDIIKQANQGKNKVWELVHILENEGEIQKTSAIRRPSFYINLTTEICQLSDTETLVIARYTTVGDIVDYRLIKFDPKTNSYEGALRPF